MKNWKEYTWLVCTGLLTWCIMACGMMMLSQDSYNWQAFGWQMLGHFMFMLAVRAATNADQARKGNA